MGYKKVDFNTLRVLWKGGNRYLLQLGDQPYGLPTTKWILQSEGSLSDLERLSRKLSDAMDNPVKGLLFRYGKNAVFSLHPLMVRQMSDQLDIYIKQIRSGLLKRQN